MDAALSKCGYWNAPKTESFRDFDTTTGLEVMERTNSPVALKDTTNLEKVCPVAALAVALIGDPLIVMTIVGAIEFGKRPGFPAVHPAAQISEFSLNDTVSKSMPIATLCRPVRERAGQPLPAIERITGEWERI